MLSLVSAICFNTFTSMLGLHFGNNIGIKLAQASLIQLRYDAANTFVAGFK